MSFYYFYAYAVNDPAYPGDPKFWGLDGFTLGNAAKLGWDMDLKKTCQQGSSSLLAALKRHGNLLTLAIPFMGSSTEPKWNKGRFYDQLFISITDKENEKYLFKMGFYHIKVEKMTVTPPNGTFSRQTTNILCNVVRGAYVADISFPER